MAVICKSIYFIGEIIFHLLNVRITEKTTGYATNSKKYKMYGDTSKYGIYFFVFILTSCKVDLPASQPHE